MEPAIQGLALLKTFTLQVRHHVEDIFGALVGHLTEALRNEKHLRHYDDAARLEALRSLADTDLITGFPDNITTESDLERIFGSYPEVGGTFWDAWIHSSQIAQKRVLRNIGSPGVDLPAASVSAAFFPCLDKMIVPAGLLRPPVFVPGAPPAYHYGTIGTIIAQALMSGGCGTEPSLRHSAWDCINWWEPLAKSLYERQTHCAGAETSPINDNASIVLNKEVTGVPESVIEVASSSVAYRAFRELLASEGGRQLLPSLNYTADQLFFVANCALHCRDCSTATARHSPADSSHVGASVDGGAPSCESWRCNEVAKRMPEFAAAFSCSKGSPMNPRDRCGA
ncbi:endothelin-converting enzyme-like 1 [Haemaphysalis longicornis]